METLILLLCAGPSLVDAYLSLPWNTTHFFGPDGPWQAIQLTYSYSGSSDVFPINLYPGADWPTAQVYVPTTQSCANTSNDNTYCGIGGTVDLDLIPYVDDNNTDAHSWFWLAEQDVPQWTMLINGTERKLDLHTAPGFTAFNSVAAAADEAYYRFNNGRTLGAEVGLLSLGGGDAVQTESIPLNMFTYSYLQSNSYGLHVGAAQFNYTGSMVFGGYDRSRTMGPVIEFSAVEPGPVQTLDVVLGTEVGASPFSFNGTEGGLLQDDSTTGSVIPQTRPAFISPGVPYIFLTQATIDAIINTASLPVKYNQDTGHYLWNTDDPQYTKIIKSPAYLGFVFPVSPNSATNTTIKVPFALLNLTLSSQITGFDSDVPYFPLFPSDNTHLIQKSLRLGRAFLQAAYIGRNWANNASWLTQAPGPSVLENSEPRDLPSDATTIEVYSTDSDAFKQSWAGIWEITPVTSESNTNSSSTGSAPSNSTSASSGGGLSTGAIAGIAVGCAVGGLLVIGAIVWWVLRRRRQRKKEEAAQVVHHHPEKQPSPSPRSSSQPVQKEPNEGGYGGGMAELQGQNQMQSNVPYELSATQRAPQELPASRY